MYRLGTQSMFSTLLYIFSIHGSLGWMFKKLHLRHASKRIYVFLYNVHYYYYYYYYYPILTKNFNVLIAKLQNNKSYENPCSRYAVFIWITYGRTDRQTWRSCDVCLSNFSELNALTICSLTDSDYCFIFTISHCRNLREEHDDRRRIRTCKLTSLSLRRNTQSRPAVIYT